MTATAPTVQVPTPARPRLPVTLYVLAGLMLLKAVLLTTLIIGASLPTLRQYLSIVALVDLAEALEELPVAGAVGLAFAGLLVLSVVGLLARRRFGWLLAMVLTGLFIAVDIYGFVSGVANHLWQVLNIVTVFYLNQRDVRDAVGATAAAPEPAGPVP